MYYAFCAYCDGKIPGDLIWEALDYDDIREAELECPECGKTVIVGVQYDPDFYSLKKR